MLPRKATDNIPYIVWFFIYAAIFWLLTGASLGSLITVIAVYAILLIIAGLPVAERLWRLISGVRPLRLRSEKERLLPLFKEVYSEAVKIQPNLPRNIHLFIKEDMNVNAFAFGWETLVITRGSLELLDDECLKGLIAHELGHFAQGHDSHLVYFHR